MNDRDPGQPQPDRKPRLKLLLLPGMDGTGELFAEFRKLLPEWINAEVVRYPGNKYYSFADLVPVVRSALPMAEPFVILAESFSTPIAVRVAADSPANLVALIVCAGFVESPIRGLPARVLSSWARMIFRLPFPAFVIRALLIGSGAPSELVKEVQKVISSVSRDVLAQRFRAILSCSESDSLATVRGPLLYLQPTGDRLVGASSFYAIRKAKPDTILKRVAGPHFLLQREPQASMSAILAFLESLT